MTKITGENKRGSISQTIEAPILRTQDNKKTPLDKSLGGHEVRIRAYKSNHNKEEREHHIGGLPMITY